MQRAARQSWLVVVALGATLGGCAHAPLAPRAEVRYPPLPAEALARYLDAIPGGAFAPPTRSPLHRFADAVAGIDATQERPLFDNPFGLAAGAGDLLVVTDPDRPQVLRLDLARETLEPVVCAGHPWAAPVAAVVAPDGLLFVADAGAAAVVRVDRSGTCTLLGLGALERPTGLAILGSRLYAADPPRHQVVVLAFDGAVLSRLGAGEDPAVQLHFPSAVAATPAGELLVVDTLNFRVVRLDAAGGLLGVFGSADRSEGGLARPKAVAVDGQGRAFVSDAELGVVVAYDAAGRYLFTLGAPGDGPADLSIPGGLAVRGRLLYVADGPHRRIQVYELLGERS
jgi:hypothetical protein